MGLLDLFTGKYFYLAMAILMGLALPTVWNVWQVNPSTWNMIVLGCCVLGLIFGVYKFMSLAFNKPEEDGQVQIS